MRYVKVFDIIFQRAINIKFKSNEVYISNSVINSSVEAVYTKFSSAMFGINDLCHHTGKRVQDIQNQLHHLRIIRLVIRLIVT